jgi:hypothetical protein
MGSAMKHETQDTKKELVCGLSGPERRQTAGHVISDQLWICICALCSILAWCLVSIAHGAAPELRSSCTISTRAQSSGVTTSLSSTACCCFAEGRAPKKKKKRRISGR